MMVATHYLSGALVGLVLARFEPSSLVWLVGAGIAGAAVPDVDMVWEHRKTTHRPFQGMAVAFVAFLAYFATGATVALVATAGAAAFAVHALTEVFSQGKTMRPDAVTSDRAVYDHVRQRWLQPVRLVNGASRRDLALTCLLALPFLAVSSRTVRATAALLVAFGAFNTVVSDRLSQDILDGYDRYSEFIQTKLDYGPETRVDD